MDRFRTAVSSFATSRSPTDGSTPLADAQPRQRSDRPSSTRKRGDKDDRQDRRAGRKDPDSGSSSSDKSAESAGLVVVASPETSSDKKAKQAKPVEDRPITSSKDNDGVNDKKKTTPLRHRRSSSDPPMSAVTASSPIQEIITPGVLRAMQDQMRRQVSSFTAAASTAHSSTMPSPLSRSTAGQDQQQQSQGKKTEKQDERKSRTTAAPDGPTIKFFVNMGLDEEDHRQDAFYDSPASTAHAGPPSATPSEAQRAHEARLANDSEDEIWKKERVAHEQKERERKEKELETERQEKEAEEKRNKRREEKERQKRQEEAERRQHDRERERERDRKRRDEQWDREEQHRRDREKKAKLVDKIYRALHDDPTFIFTLKGVLADFDEQKRHDERRASGERDIQREGSATPRPRLPPRDQAKDTRSFSREPERRPDRASRSHRDSSTVSPPVERFLRREGDREHRHERGSTASSNRTLVPDREPERRPPLATATSSSMTIKPASNTAQDYYRSSRRSRTTASVPSSGERSHQTTATSSTRSGKNTGHPSQSPVNDGPASTHSKTRLNANVTAYEFDDYY